MIGGESLGFAVASRPSPPDRPVSGSSYDGDLLLLVPKAAPLSTLQAARAIAETQTTPQVPHRPAGQVPIEPGPSMPSAAATTQPSASLVIPSTSSSDTSNVAPQRSARSTAGHHSNVHCIPGQWGTWHWGLQTFKVLYHMLLLHFLDPGVSHTRFGLSLG